MNLPQKFQWHQILISLLIGFILGAAFVKWEMRNEFGPRHFMDGKGKERMIQRFSRQLKLSEEQKKQVRAIFEAKHPQMVALHEEMRPRFEAIRNATHEEIRKVLTPEQQVKFNEIIAKREERFKKYREKFQEPNEEKEK